MQTRPSFRVAVQAAVTVLVALACGSTPTTNQAGLTEQPDSPLPTLAEAVPTSATAATAEASPSVSVPTTPTTPARQDSDFHVAVIVDLQSEPVGREQAAAVIDEARQLLQPLTSVKLVMDEFAEDNGGGSASDLVSRHIHPEAATQPNGIVLFSFGDGGQARQSGGYSFAVTSPPGPRNAFVSPLMGNGQIYVAVIHFSHKYAPCGYGGADTPQSATSLGSECRNQAGTACAQHNGYSMCADSVSHLYASTPTRFTAAIIVHELMHPFSVGGDQDHFNTPECNTRMGYPAQFFDLQEAQYNNGLCPYVYEEFKRSHQP